MIDRFYQDQAERVVKRLKKAELVEYLARLEQDHARKLEELRKLLAKAEKKAAGLKLEGERVDVIRNAIAQVLALRGAPVNSERQLTLLLRSNERPETDDDDDKLPNTPAGVLAQILDNCNDVMDNFVGGATTYDDLEQQLSAALDDRAALLKLVGMTDAEWSAAGGASYADVGE
jgi:hypothetical protein